MASKGRQRYDSSSDSYSIEIIPEGTAATHGRVHESKGTLISPWSFGGTGEIWVDVGKHKSGKITEEGFSDQSWAIIGI